MSVSLSLPTVQEAAQRWKQNVSKHSGEGLKGAFLLVEEGTGKALSITLWESAEALDRYNQNPAQAKDGKEMSKYFTTTPEFTLCSVAGVIKQF